MIGKSSNPNNKFVRPRFNNDSFLTKKDLKHGVINAVSKCIWSNAEKTPRPKPKNWKTEPTDFTPYISFLKKKGLKIMIINDAVETMKSRGLICTAEGDPENYYTYNGKCDYPTY